MTRHFATIVSAGMIAAAPAAAQTAPPSAPAPASAAVPDPASPPLNTRQVSRAASNYPKPQVQLLPPGGGLAPAKPVGPLSGFGRTLADKGIYLRLLGVDEFAGNVTGGQGRGVANSYAIPFGTDLDLGRMVGLPGAFVHFTMNVSKGSSLAADHTGNAISFQTRFKTYQNLRLAALAVEQNLFDGKVNISGGRVSPLTYFNASPIYCTFQNNSVCFNPAVVPIQDRALGFFPYGTWGGRVKIAPTKSFYVQAGIFEANPALIPSNGFDFSTRQSTGHQTALEVGLQSASPTATHAYHLRVGGYQNTADVTDPYLNVRREPRITAGGSALVHDGQAGWYVMGDVVAARLGGNAKRTVTVFGGLIGAVPDYVAFKSQAIAGVVVSGPFASRPEDTLGLVGSYIRLGDRQVDFLQASRVAAGGTDRVYRGEGVFEINYGITAARGVRLSPNLQYVLNPDNLPRPRAIRRSGDILAFGMRLSVDMATILGMPVLR